MRRTVQSIPDHDRESVSEALEAALYCAAFQRLEEAEMKKLISEIKSAPERPEATERVRRRLEGRRRLCAVKAALPRLAQATAAVIALVTIGTGIALAASPAARRWAAGALYSRVVEPDGFFGEVRGTLTGGAAAQGRLLVVEDNHSVSVYEGTDAQPAVYEWRDAGSRAIDALAADGDDIYALYAEHGDEPVGFDSYVPRAFGLGRVALGAEGVLEVTGLAEVPASAILDPQGRRLNSFGISGAALADGQLYFTAEYALESEQEGFSFKPANVRLFRWDTAGGAPEALSLEGVPLDWSPELFGGGDGLFLAAYDDGASLARIYRIEGAALSPVCEAPYSGVRRPGSFAHRAGDDALLYALDGSVWMAPAMDPTRAARVAVCGEINGPGLMPDGETYAVVTGGEVRLFDLTAPVGELDELVVDGMGSSDIVRRLFAEAHPDVALVSDPDQSMEDLGEYAQRLLDGRARADVVTLDGEDYERVRDAGLIAPLTDPELVAEWEKLPPRLREYLSVDGRPAAVPLDLFAYADVMFLPETWDAVRGSFDDLPDTWADYLRWLAEFSHSDAAGTYTVQFEPFEGVDLDLPGQFEMYTLWRMADDFTRCWAALGEPQDFERAEFADCVRALDGVDWSALRYDADDGPGAERRAVTFFGVYDPLFSEIDWSRGQRTLRIRDDAPRLSRASGAFTFVSAASTRRASAQEYLKTLARVNRTGYDGQLPAAAGYDFATDPETLARASGGLCTADSILRYRDRVGDFTFRPDPSREAVLALRERAEEYVKRH